MGATMNDGYVIRHPKRGKAHRLQYRSAFTDRPVTGCNRWADAMTETVPLMQCAPADLCSVCFVTWSDAS